jgi:hypothetical protein
MSFEEDFDGIIRRKAEETHVPFNEADWLKASALLDAQRKPASLAWVYYAAAALLITAGVAWFYPGAPATVNAEKSIATANAAHQTPESTDQRLSSQNNLSKNGVSTHPSSTNNTTDITTETVNREETSTTALPVASHATRQSVQQQRSAATLTQAVSVPQQGVQMNPLVEKAEEGKATSNLANATTLKNEGFASTENSTTNSAASTPSTPVTPTPSSPETLNSPTNAGVNKTVSEAVTPDPALLPQTAFTQEEINAGSWIYLRSKYSHNEQIVEVTTSLLPMNRPDPEDYSKAKLKTHYARIGAGVAASNGWQGAKGNDGKSLSPLIAGEYGVYFAKRFSLNAGVKLWQIANIHSPWYKVSSVSYNYFYTTTGVELTTTTMKMLSVPFGIAWHPHRRHQITAGIQMNRVIAAENTLTYSGPLETTGANRTEQKNGLYDGMNLFTWAAQAGYRYECMHRVSLVANVQLQLQSFFNGNMANAASMRPVFVNGGLAYTLFDK